MSTVCDLNRCTGCMACIDRCNNNSITIVDSLKYYNAVINEESCRRCSACYRVCPVINLPELQNPIAWKQGWSCDSKIREEASSGGVATSIACEFIKREGIVCGCIFEKGNFHFDIIEYEQDVRKLFGSKYVKSNPEGIYKKVKRYLTEGKKVLFIGLPCQVAAVKNYIKDDLMNKLYTIDLICHGTPSPQILKFYLREMNYDITEVKDIVFRQNHSFQLQVDLNKIATNGMPDLYSMSFLNGISYTENCYECRYAQIERTGDLTLGDSWGTFLSDEEQNKGISLILCQTDKGKELMDIGRLHLEDVDLDRAISANHQLSKPTERPPRYNLFFQGLNKGKTVSYMTMRCYPKMMLKRKFAELKAQLNKMTD